MRFPASNNPKTFTLSAVIVGYALIDDLTANEQNSLGNWLMMVGQLLETNSSQQQVIEERINGNTININGNNYKQCGDPYMHNPPLYNKNSTTNNNENDINLIKKTLDRMQKEMNKMVNKD